MLGRRFPPVVLAACIACACSSLACSSPTAATPPPTPVDPPKITCPSPLTLTSPLGEGMSVVYGAATVAGGKEPVTTTCTPASGSTFPVGSTTVTCSAIDAQQRADSCTFPVTVNLPPRISATRFVAFGDSMTFGEDGNTLGLKGLTPTREQFLFGPMSVLYGSEYPTVLRQELAGRYTTQASLITVLNKGQAGEALGDTATLTRFTNDVLNTDREVVLIMEGSNDLYAEYSAPNTAAGAAIESLSLNNLLTMLSRAKGRNIRPYVATVPPANPAGFRGRLVYPFVDGFNQKIRQVAMIQNVPLADVNAAFRGDLSLLSDDGYHPNAAGYQRIADTFFDALQNTLEIR